MTDLTSLPDPALIERLQRGAFSYFIEYSNPENGLIADTSRPGSPCSIAVVGFALSCYPVAVENGWLSRAEAVERTLAALRFFSTSVQSDQPDAAGYRGFYYHFLDMHTGRRVWQCELSLIDTALLAAGMLTVASYFKGDGAAEAEIRSLADALYRRIDWRWAQDGGESVTQGWKPECGFLHYGWEGYNEASILYVLGLGSPNSPFTESGYTRWRLTYQWEHLDGFDVLYSGPLFTHLFSHAWIDFRGIRDEFMREKDSDYFANTQAAIGVHREYAERNPRGFTGYGRNFWGVTAGDGPTSKDLRVHGRDLRFFGYMSRGVPYGPDDGTIAPWAMLATLPFDRTAALAGTRQLLADYPEVCTRDRFSSGFNASLLVDGKGWLSEGWFGLDQGLVVMMIENHRSGLIWDLLRQSEFARAGLARAGFTGGWLKR
jgi:hypothetical protein